MSKHSNVSCGSMAKGKKTLAIMLVFVLVAGLTAGTFLTLSNSARAAECTSETVIKVVDAVGRAYCDFSGQIEGTDKSFTANDGILYGYDLGLEEGKYTLTITEINGRETSVSQEIEVVSDEKVNVGTENDENNQVDELLIATEDPMTDADRYRPLLKKYVQAIEENWTAEKWEAAGLSVMMGQLRHDYWAFTDTYEIGYQIEDIDENGREELMIYSIEKPDIIYAVYGLKDDEVTCLIEADHIGTAWCYCGKNHFFYGDDYYALFGKIEDETFSYFDGLYFDGESFWKLVEKDGEYVQDPISVDEYLAFEAQYPITAIIGQPLSEIID